MGQRLENEREMDTSVLCTSSLLTGGSPYPGLPPTEIYQFIMDGNRMEQPLDCPDQM